jgi:ribosomal protein L11 methyltransferase
MKYYEVKFSIEPLSGDACDLLAALAGDAGFETFENTDTGLTGYVQQALFDQQVLDGVLQQFPMPDVSISYTVSEAEDRDWNEQWEQEGFEPIVVGDRLVIHDGRHGEKGEMGEMGVMGAMGPIGRMGRMGPIGPMGPMGPMSPILIEIDAHLAFGTGTHETTQMVCGTLLDMDLSGVRVLDCGCGTGILGIAAMKLGARECVGYDIDEWSVDNTRHNAVINHVEVTPLLGDASILNKVEGLFDVVMANINRNILLNDLPAFRQKMATGAKLILSGFYTEDIPLLTEKAAKLGLSLTAQKACNDWACIVLQQS